MPLQLVSPDMKPLPYKPGRGDQGPTSLSATMPKVEPLPHQYRLRRRVPPPLGCTQNLALARDSWGQDEKSWYPSPNKKVALWLEAIGRGSPVFLAASGICTSLSWEGGGRKQSWFTYHRLTFFFPPSCHRFCWIDGSLFAACVYDHFQI